MLVRLAVFLGACLLGCAAAPVPEANGYNVELFFEGVPVGTPIAIGKPAEVTVHRIEQQTDRCTSDDSACDPTTETPIVLISAACDAPCVVTPSATDDGSVALRTSSATAGATTLHVSVRSAIDGSEWDDSYPLAFR